MPKKPSLLYLSFILVITLAGLHFLAEAFYLYWTYWWYDWVLHFIGGLSIGLVIYWVLFDSGLWGRRAETVLVPVLSVLTCLLLIGVAWEIMEYVYGITDSHEAKYFDDVMHDLIADAAGAILAALIGVKMTYLSYRSMNSRNG